MMNSGRLFLANMILHIIPPTRCFSFKRKLYRWCGANIGEGVKIVSSVRIIGNGALTIGDNTWIGHYTTIICTSQINIGKNCDIAPNVFIDNGTHIITPDKDRIAGIDCNKDITVGNGCWICAGAYILPGVTIGNMNVIAAGAIVTRSIDNYNLVVGIPGRIIKKFDLKIRENF